MPNWMLTIAAGVISATGFVALLGMCGWACAIIINRLVRGAKTYRLVLRYHMRALRMRGEIMDNVMASNPAYRDTVTSLADDLERQAKRNESHACDTQGATLRVVAYAQRHAATVIRDLIVDEEEADHA